MSTVTEEDTELRDLVATTLDNCGILGKIKAQLRANVYIALEQGDNVKNKSTLVNNKLTDFLSTTNGRLVASLVREFLVFFDLDFTLAVFDPETNIDNHLKYRGREKLTDALGLTELTDTKSPLLSEILRLSKVSILKSETPTPTFNDDDDEDGTSLQSSIAEEAVSEKSRSKSISERSSAGSQTLTESPRKLSPDGDHHQNKLDLDHFLNKPSPVVGVSTPDRSMDPPTPLQNATFSLDSAKKLEQDASPFQGALSSLGDLPPLGSLSALGDLPPLSLGRSNPLGPLEGHGRSSLAPLKKIPSVSKQDSMESNLSSASKRDLPVLGFERDHVISEESSVSSQMKMKEDRFNKEKERDAFAEVAKGRDEEPASLPASVEEDIEEELDSFLNSSVSGTEDFTKDEAVVNSDASLKADYLESL